MNKEIIKKELESCRYRLNLFQTQGLKIFETHKELIYEMLISKLKEDVKYFEDLLLNNENKSLNS